MLLSSPAGDVNSPFDEHVELHNARGCVSPRTTCPLVDDINDVTEGTEYSRRRIYWSAVSVAVTLVALASLLGSRSQIHVAITEASPQAEVSLEAASVPTNNGHNIGASQYLQFSGDCAYGYNDMTPPGALNQYDCMTMCNMLPNCVGVSYKYGTHPQGSKVCTAKECSTSGDWCVPRSKSCLHRTTSEGSTWYQKCPIGYHMLTVDCYGPVLFSSTSCTVEDCAEKCSAEEACRGFSYVANTCMLKRFSCSSGKAAVGPITGGVFFARLNSTDTGTCGSVAKEKGELATIASDSFEVLFGNRNPLKNEKQDPTFLSPAAPCTGNSLHLELGGDNGDYFRCVDGTCISMHGRCNGIANCRDASDELGCPGSCVDVDSLGLGLYIKDTNGHRCEDYYKNLDWCGRYDKVGFKASALCCACGGGGENTDNGATDSNGQPCAGYARNPGWCNDGLVAAPGLWPEDFNPRIMCASCGGGCRNTNYEARDKYGRSCADYSRAPHWCGKYDDSDFKSKAMCCACGGGNMDSSAGNQNLNGKFCSDYLANPGWCGSSSHDTAAFVAKTMCTACGGGDFFHRGCADTDFSATDKESKHCSNYYTSVGVPQSAWCGHHDTENFKANDMCCACGGGVSTKRLVTFDGCAARCVALGGACKGFSISKGAAGDKQRCKVALASLTDEGAETSTTWTFYNRTTPLSYFEPWPVLDATAYAAISKCATATVCDLVIFEDGDSSADIRGGTGRSYAAAAGNPMLGVFKDRLQDDLLMAKLQAHTGVEASGWEAALGQLRGELRMVEAVSEWYRIQTVFWSDLQTLMFQAFTNMLTLLSIPGDSIVVNKKKKKKIWKIVLNCVIQVVMVVGAAFTGGATIALDAGITMAEQAAKDIKKAQNVVKFTLAAIKTTASIAKSSVACHSGDTCGHTRGSTPGWYAKSDGSSDEQAFEQSILSYNSFVTKLVTKLENLMSQLNLQRSAITTSYGRLTSAFAAVMACPMSEVDAHYYANKAFPALQWAALSDLMPTKYAIYYQRDYRRASGSYTPGCFYDGASKGFGCQGTEAGCYYPPVSDWDTLNYDPYAGKSVVWTADRAVWMAEQPPNHKNVVARNFLQGLVGSESSPVEFVNLVYGQGFQDWFGAYSLFTQKCAYVTKLHAEGNLEPTVPSSVASICDVYGMKLQAYAFPDCKLLSERQAHYQTSVMNFNQKTYIPNKAGHYAHTFDGQTGCCVPWVQPEKTSSFWPLSEEITPAARGKCDFALCNCWTLNRAQIGNKWYDDVFHESFPYLKGWQGWCVHANYGGDYDSSEDQQNTVSYMLNTSLGMNCNISYILDSENDYSQCSPGTTWNGSAS